MSSTQNDIDAAFVREARIGLAVVSVLLAIFFYVAYGKLSGWDKPQPLAFQSPVEQQTFQQSQMPGPFSGTPNSLLPNSNHSNHSQPNTPGALTPRPTTPGNNSFAANSQASRSWNPSDRQRFSRQVRVGERPDRGDSNPLGLHHRTEESVAKARPNAQLHPPNFTANPIESRVNEVPGESVAVSPTLPPPTRPDGSSRIKSGSFVANSPSSGESGFVPNSRATQFTRFPANNPPPPAAAPNRNQFAANPSAERSPKKSPPSITNPQLTPFTPQPRKTQTNSLRDSGFAESARATERKRDKPPASAPETTDRKFTNKPTRNSNRRVADNSTRKLELPTVIIPGLDPNFETQVDSDPQPQPTGSRPVVPASTTESLRTRDPVADAIPSNFDTTNVPSTNVPSQDPAIEIPATRDASQDSQQASRLPRKDETTVSQDGEGFWLVAQRVYGDGRYFDALFQLNKDRVNSFNELPTGTRLLTPSIEVLRERWPRLCPRPQLRTVGGETLFEIASENLGQASQYVKLLKLNYDRLPKGVKPDTPLPADLLLELPRTR